MTVTFQCEPVKRIVEDSSFRPLMLDHWEELGVHKNEMPLDPDWPEFIKAESMGYFRAWTARDGDTLVGYIAFWIRPHAHYRSTLTAIDDLFMLAPEYRKGMTGYRMFTTALEQLKELGVKRVMLHDKEHFEQRRGGLRKVFERMGFIRTDNIYSRMI